MALTLTGSDGQLAAAKGTIYTAGNPGVVLGIVLVNTSAADVTFNLYIKRGATSRRITEVDQALPAYGRYEDSGRYTLDSSDLVEGDASAATTVDYVLSVIERS